MTDTSIIYPSNVRQPLADTLKKNPFPCCIEAVDRDGSYEGYYCASRQDPRYYHEWTNAIELTRGGETQCGRPSNYYCDHATYYQIAGYRNTCPIAGCSGTYFQPAILQLELGKNHLENYEIIEGTEIHSITLNFSHRCLGVDVADSSTSTNWGPNFCGYDKHPDLKVLKVYLTNEQGLIRGNICVHNQNPPLKGFAGVSMTITGVTYEDIANGHLNIEYQRNLSTNPGNIYIRDLSIKLEYTNAYPFMYGTTFFPILYTSNIKSCCTSEHHLIDAGYENKNGRIPASKAPRDLTDDVIVQVPNGVKYTREKIQGHLFFTYTDESNVAGVKYITYILKGTDKRLTYGYEAKKYKFPEIKLERIYYKNRIARPDTIYISNDSCVDTMEFYVDGFDTDPIITFKSSNNDFDFTKDNIVTPASNDKFYYTIAENVSCGYHRLFIKMNKNNEYTWGNVEAITIDVRGPILELEYYVETQEDVDMNPTETPLSFFNYVQNKQNDKRIIKIKRTDNFPTRWKPKFFISTDTNYQNTTQNDLDTINKGLQEGSINLDHNETAKFDVSVKYPGRYYLNIEAYQDEYAIEHKGIEANTCGKFEDFAYIDIEPHHIQYHDELFVRGEDSTSFKYNYLVAWEGDNIEEPINVSDVNIGQSFNDIKLCVEHAEFFTGLSQIGLAKLKVTNNSQKTLNNIRIELNVLAKDDDGNYVVTLDEFLKPDGVFKYLENNFYSYNKENINNVFIRNLPYSIDDDDIGEENVEILIKTLDYDETLQEGDSIEIIIPYMSRTDKTIKIQPLIFEEPFPLYLYQDCEFKQNPLDSFKLTVYDSILTRLEIEGETDLLETKSKYCPNECFDTALTYKITNIDSSYTERKLVKTEIINDANLIPYSIQLKGQSNTMQINNIANTTNNIVSWSHDEKYKTKDLSYAVIDAYIKFPGHKQYILTRRTNNKGKVIFEIRVPESVSKTYTLKSLLQNVIKFQCDGNIEHQTGILYIDKNKNLINISDEKNNKSQVVMNYQNTYKKYRANDLIQITLNVSYRQKYLDNTLTFYSNVQEPGKTDELTVYYKICNLQNKGKDIYNHDIMKYNQGILQTTFKTNDYQLIENEITQDIYCGIPTDLRHSINIEKRIIEQNQLNIINIEVDNYNRDNKEVKCLIDLGPTEVFLGKYNIVEINVDDGNTQIQEEKIVTNNTTQSENEEKNNMKINWLIGEMKADTSTKAQIILKGADIGMSEISVLTSDFMFTPECNKDYHFGEKRCNC